MKRRVYIYQKDMNDELVELFNNFGPNIEVEAKDQNTLQILDRDFYNPEPIDLESFQELIQDDFGGEVVIFVEPYLEEDFVLGEGIKSFLSYLPFGVYFLEDVITHVVLKNNVILKNDIKSYIASKVNNEVVHTVREFIENNMNSSLSAKKLYMHRNTLNYRIDNFTESTNINVKTFKGANAIYMLYKY